MPRVFERDGYKFFFYSNEHRPIHVHVQYGGGEAVFDVEDRIELRESQGDEGQGADEGAGACGSAPRAYYKEVG